MLMGVGCGQEEVGVGDTGVCVCRVGGKVWRGAVQLQSYLSFQMKKEPAKKNLESTLVQRGWRG